MAIPLEETREGSLDIGSEIDLQGAIEGEDENLQTKSARPSNPFKQKQSDYAGQSTNLMKNRVVHQGQAQSNQKPGLDDFKKGDQMAQVLGDSFKRVSLSGDEDAGYIPLSCLNTFTPDWAIKVRLAKKYPMKSWNNARGTGELFSCELIDRSDCLIQATFF